ncbi:MAG: hypothetical protein AAYR33_03580 [Acetobacteraceae bacterium]
MTRFDLDENEVLRIGDNQVNFTKWCALTPCKNIAVFFLKQACDAIFRREATPVGISTTQRSVQRYFCCCKIRAASTAKYVSTP